MSDFKIYPFSFSDTTVTIEPVSEKGKLAFRDHFRAGDGCVSWTMQKSGGMEFVAELERIGLTVS